MPRNDPVLLKAFKTHRNAASNQEMATSFSPYSDESKGTGRVTKKNGLSMLLRQRHGHPQTSSSMGQPWQVEEASLVSFCITWCTFETDLVNMGLSRCN